MSIGLRAAAVRRVLAVVIAGDLLSFWIFIRNARAEAAADGVAIGTLLASLSSIPVVTALIAIGGVATWRFARRADSLVAGFVTLATLTALSTIHAQLYGTPWRHLFFSGLCLLGWLVGLLVGRLDGRRGDETYAQVGSIALLGAAYMSSAISKLMLGGIDWASGFPIQVVVVGQDGLAADGILSSYRHWIAMSPRLAAVFAIATVLFEMAGPLMLAGRLPRFLVASGLLAMHINIFLLTDILYWESMVLLVLFGLLARIDDVDDAAEVAEPYTAAGNGRFAVAVVALAACAAVAIAHQARRAARPTGPAMVRHTLQRVGPFQVGQVFAKQWAVESLSLSDAGVVLWMSGPGQRARFEVTCAADEPAEAFDLGPAHIVHDGAIAGEQLDSLGQALREHVQRDVQRDDVCSALAGWRRMASASGEG